MELQAAYGAYRPTPPTRPPNPNDDFGQVRGTILAHQSTMAHSALSRTGFYPQGAVAEIRRREAHSYAENLDQPFHAADDDDRDGGGSGIDGADGDGHADEDAWLEQQQSQQVARRKSPNTRSRSRSSPSRSRSAMDQRLQLYDDDEERQRRTRTQLEEAQKRMQSVRRRHSQSSGMRSTRLIQGANDVEICCSLPPLVTPIALRSFVSADNSS